MQEISARGDGRFISIQLSRGSCFVSKLNHRSSQLSLDSTNLAQVATYSYFVPMCRNSSTAVRRSPFSCVLKRRLYVQLLACYTQNSSAHSKEKPYMVRRNEFRPYRLLSQTLPHSWGSYASVTNFVSKQTVLIKAPTLFNTGTRVFGEK